MNELKFEASVEVERGIKLAIEGKVSGIEGMKLKEVVEKIRESVLTDFNQGTRQFTKEEIRVKIIKEK